MPKGVYARKTKSPVKVATEQQSALNERLPKVEEGRPADYKPSLAHTDRLSMLNTIAERSNADRETEIAAQGEAIDTSAEDSMREDNEEIKENIATIEATPKVTVETPKKKIKGIVDGVEKEFDEEEILKAGLATLQKQTAADERLEEAKRLLEEARAQRQPKELQPSATSLADVDSSRLPVLDAAAIAKSMMYGNDEEATKAIEQLLGPVREAHQLVSKRKELNPDEIAQFVNEAYNFNEAKRKFQLPVDQGGYLDIWDDPQLRKMVFDKENELIQKGDKRPYFERFKAIGDEVRTWRDNLIQKHTPKTLEGREEKKREATVIKGASARAVSPDSSDKPPSREDVLNQMRKSRNQLSIN